MAAGSSSKNDATRVSPRGKFTKRDENRHNNLLWLQDGFSKAYEEVLIQGNLSSSSWWI